MVWKTLFLNSITWMNTFDGPMFVASLLFCAFSEFVFPSTVCECPRKTNDVNGWFVSKIKPFFVFSKLATNTPGTYRTAKHVLQRLMYSHEVSVNCCLELELISELGSRMKNHRTKISRVKPPRRNSLG